MSEEKKIAKAKLGFTRQTARKVRRVANLIRGTKAGEAAQQLKFMPYQACDQISKLLKSAMANAAHNLELENPEELIISEILVDDCTMYKRFRAMSKGRAYSIKKRTSQVSIALSEMTPAEYGKHVWDISPRNKKNQKQKKEVAN